MSKIKKIGLTGGIASGKSTVVEILRQMDAVVIDCDKLARQVIEPTGTAFVEFKQQFADYFVDDVNVDRERLATAIFADSTMRKKIEAIIHPAVKKEIERIISQLPIDIDRVVIDVPLLFEVGWHKAMDEVWLVWVDKKTQLSRLMQRDGLTLSAAEIRVAAQMPYEKKLALADCVIENNGDLLQLKEQIFEIWHSGCKTSV